MKKRKKRISRGKEIFLWLLGILLILVAGVSIYTGKVYFDVRAATDKTYKTVERISVTKRKGKVDYEKGQPFSVLMLGVDTGDFGRTEQGRSDSIMVATVNPQTKTTTLVSIARDTYTEIVGKHKSDKVNHAYAYGGVPMAIATVENLLDIPIDHYVEINMKGIKDVVDAVGGVEVSNAFSFNYEGSNFPIGKLHLNGEEALKYSRMRYDDPHGDYGRQDRQRRVISGIVDRMKSVNTLTNYSYLFDILGNNTKTDISWKILQVLLTSHRPALTKITSEQLSGTGFTGDGVTGEKGISYQRVDGKELQRVQQKLKKQLGETTY